MFSILHCVFSQVKHSALKECRLCAFSKQGFVCAATTLSQSLAPLASFQSFSSRHLHSFYVTILLDPGYYHLVQAKHFAFQASLSAESSFPRSNCLLSILPPSLPTSLPTYLSSFHPPLLPIFLPSLLPFLPSLFLLSLPPSHPSILSFFTSLHPSFPSFMPSPPTPIQTYLSPVECLTSPGCSASCC